ncbi:MAG: 2-C-methyl-D-erythritol 4-phosphate cytidylyltransferase [Acidobacteriota bacterium]|jgi:2-C-methyl-D-erythritol 4-phosphate cytidylyltransferase|nr:2-C-methyl-D-erythritol 4-phosphate cytidylyltransferase [Acidobacteriota bacterium]
MNTAIIVAAGSGKRFGGHIPKQFIEIHGKPVLIHTLERFEMCDLVDEIVLVLAADEINNFSGKVQKYNFTKLNKIITGGNSRAESVFNGLKTIDKKSAEIIAIHDGARPLVSVEEISKTIKIAEEHGAACLVGKVTDTIKEISDGKIVKTIDRTKLRRALTPQCFRYEMLIRAFEENDIGKIATDECFLIEQMGIEIKIVEGSSKNIKITHEEDLKFAEIFLQK